MFNVFDKMNSAQTLNAPVHPIACKATSASQNCITRSTPRDISVVGMREWVLLYISSSSAFQSWPQVHGRRRMNGGRPCSLVSCCFQRDEFKCCVCNGSCCRCKDRQRQATVRIRCLHSGLCAAFPSSSSSTRVLVRVTPRRLGRSPNKTNWSTHFPPVDLR